MTPPAESRSQMPTYLTVALTAESQARRDGELLKETRSYCPACFKEIAASVYAVNDLVWLYKTCPEHGPSQGLLERNVPFYRAVMNVAPAPRKPKWALLVTVTHRCNLNCHLCFVPKRDRDDLSQDQLKRIIDEAEAPWIVMTGGEPTVREDLTGIVRHTRQIGKNAAMNSNGLLLADEERVKALADAGLEVVLLSFNGVTDDVFVQINGRPLFDLKRRALENLIKYKIATILSPTVMRGINEDLGPIIRLCFEYAPEVYQLRMRGASHVGRHGEFEPFTMSEMVDLLARRIGRTVPQLLAGFNRDSCYHSANQWIMEGAFFKDGDRKGELYAWDNGEFEFEARPVSEFQQRVAQELGGDTSLEGLARRFTPMGFHLWHWTDIYNFDLEEIHGHGVDHLWDNRVPINFLEATIRAYDI